MGGVGNLAKGVATSLQELDKQHATAAYYRRLAADKDYQAAYAAATVQRNNGYLLQSAHEQAQEIYNNYRQNNATQRAGLAAMGLRQDSQTVQRLLQNSRFQTLLDEENLKQNLQTSLYENNLAAAQQVRALTSAAKDYRRSASKSKAEWKFGVSLLNLFSDR